MGVSYGPASGPGVSSGSPPRDDLPGQGGQFRQGGVAGAVAAGEEDGDARGVVERHVGDARVRVYGGGGGGRDPLPRPAAMAASQSSVLATVRVAAGRACGGHSSGVVMPETVFRTTGPSTRSARRSDAREASGPSAVTAATRPSVNSTSVTSPGAWTGPRSSAASTSPRVSPAVRSSIRSSSSGVAG